MSGNKRGRQPGEELTATHVNDSHNSTSEHELTLRELGISPQWTIEDIELATLKLLDDRTSLESYPAWMQLIYFVGQHVGRRERDAEVKHLSEFADDVVADRDALRKQLEPEMAWRKWLATPHNDRVGFPLSDLLGGGRRA